MLQQEITSVNAPKAIGPYSPGVKLGDFIYLSGQLPIDASTGKMVDGGIKEQTQQVILNIEALLAAQGLELHHVVKTTVFMADLQEFAEMNEVYGSYFTNTYPARSCVQVAALPLNAKVEIECLVIDTLAYEAQMAQQSGCGSSDGCSGNCSDGGCDCSGGCHSGE